MRADGGEAGDWSLRAASVVGVRHRVAGGGPEDAYGWALSENRLVLAVADGVSSQPGSDRAALAAVGAALAEPDSPLVAADAAVRSAGGATTLVVANLIPAEDHVRVELVRVGDSAAFVLRAGEWMELWPTGEGDGTIRTSTRALPGPGGLEREEPGDLGGEPSWGVMLPGDVLVLVTDGLAEPLRDGPTTVAPGLAEGLARPPDPLALAALADFTRQGCHDDRTILAVWWQPGADRNTEGASVA